MEVALSPRRSSSTTSSPEFEFWIPGGGGTNQRHPADLLTADELFVDGVLLPLHLISSLNNSNHGHDHAGVLESKLKPAGIIESPPPPEASICVSSSSSSSSSKRWKDIFKKKEHHHQQQPPQPQPAAAHEDDKERLEKKIKERPSKGSGSSAAELNINIWPFSRSRSAGTAAGRPRPAAAAAAARKPSSAPCSRSNSRGESGGARRWAPSPGRGGVHVGRASPVWRAPKKQAGMRRGLNGGGLILNVNSCIGLNGSRSSSSSCRGEEERAAAAAAAAAANNNNNNGGGGFFRIRALFTKKVY